MNDPMSCRSAALGIGLFAEAEWRSEFGLARFPVSLDEVEVVLEQKPR